MIVAAVLDQYTVAITRDRQRDQVFVGDTLSIREPIVLEEDLLGSYEKVRVKVTEVQDRLFIAETYRLSAAAMLRRDEISNAPEVVVNVGDVVEQILF